MQPVVEMKGYRREDAKEKETTMETYRVPGVNNHGHYDRWAFVELTGVYQIESDLEAKVDAGLNKMIGALLCDEATPDPTNTSIVYTILVSIRVAERFER